MRLLAYFVSFAVTALWCRGYLVADGFDSQWQGYLSDLLWALIFAIAILHRGAVLTTLTFTLWSALNLGNVSFLNVMGATVDYRDLVFLLDPVFLGSTLGRENLPILAAGILSAWALYYGFKFVLKVTRPTPDRHFCRWSLVLLAVLVTYIHQATPAPDWPVSNPAALVLADAFAAIGGKDVAHEAIVDLPRAEAKSEKLVQTGAAENVLLVVLEGIPGVYLPQVAERYNERNTVKMTRLGAWAERAWQVPEFLLHTRQTNRGLYALLCGDYPKLAGGNPKLMEMLGSREMADSCLPSILGKRGYVTAYFQAANLEFMSKDLVLPFIGFQTVLGEESFGSMQPPAATGFDWGQNDSGFFRAVLPHLQALDQGNRPWFAALLTAGTHYPYGLSAGQVKGAENLRDAAVLAADAAIDELLGELQKTGILKNALLMITSDESHGLGGHWLGQNWGFLLAVAPDLGAREQLAVSASIDIPNSVLDYLGLYPELRTFQGRSIFRRYENERRLIFAGSTLKMYDADGLVHSCARRIQTDGRHLKRECSTFAVPKNALFSRSYLPVKGDFLAAYRVLRGEYLRSEYRLSELKEWKFLASSSTADQPMANGIRRDHVQLSAPNLLTIEFGLRVFGPGHVSVRWRLVDAKSGRSVIPALVLPELETGDSMKIRYSAVLSAKSEAQQFLLEADSSAPLGIEVSAYRYALQSLEGGRDYVPTAMLLSASGGPEKYHFEYEKSDAGTGWVRAVSATSGEGGATSVLAFVDGEIDGESAPCFSRAFDKFEEDILQAYLHYYNRPADAGGLAYWSNQLRQGARTYSEVLNLFSSSDESLEQVNRPNSVHREMNRTMANRMAVARLYVTQAEGAPEREVSAVSLNELITSVDDDESSLRLACVKVQQLLKR